MRWWLFAGPPFSLLPICTPPSRMLGHMAEQLSPSTALLERANELMGTERWADAVTLLEDAPELVSNDFQLSWTAGWAQFKLGHFDLARRMLKRAVMLSPSDYAGQWALGVTLRSLGSLKPQNDLSERRSTFATPTRHDSRWHSLACNRDERPKPNRSTWRGYPDSPNRKRDGLVMRTFSATSGGTTRRRAPIKERVL